MSGAAGTAQGVVKAAHMDATQEYAALVSSSQGASPDALAAAKTRALEAAGHVAIVAHATQASRPNPAEAPVTPANVGNWLPDYPDPDLRASVVDLLGKVYPTPATIIRMAMDDGGRAQGSKDPQAEALRVIHGALGKDAPAALAAAKALVARDPKLRDLLAETGMGNSPWMVRHLAGVARKRGIA